MRLLRYGLILLLCSNLFGETFEVTHTGEEGEGSLVWALQRAQERAGADTVIFALSEDDPNYNSGRGTWEIPLAASLPVFTDDSTFIDGSSQAAAGGDSNPDGHEITITGHRTPVEVSGFIIESAHNVIRDLSIGGFRGHTFEIRGQNAAHNVIQGCHIGLDPDGLYVYKVKKSTGINIREGAHHNLIGGPEPGQGNLFAGFYYEAMEILLAAHHNRVLGNYFGVKRDGLEAAGNGWGEFTLGDYDARLEERYAAIYIVHGAYANSIGGTGTGEGNVIVCSGRSAVQIKSVDSDSNRVIGNLVGVGADGRTPLPNGEAGVLIWDGPEHNDISANVISGNRAAGVWVRGSCAHNSIHDNIIGLDCDGFSTLPNGGDGVCLVPDSHGRHPAANVIGPGNVIYAEYTDDERDPGAGVKLAGFGTVYNRVTGNHIGENASGTPFSAPLAGVVLTRGASFNVIGPDNVIAGNGSCGVLVSKEETRFNTVTRNLIYDNAGGAIVLEAGANGDVEPPLLISAAPLSVVGISQAGGTVELFSDESDQARQYLGTSQAGADGRFEWSGQVDGSQVTATVTDSLGNTSMLAVSKVVPVELASFTVRVEAQEITLLWITASETNNLGFHVERKRDGDDEFSEIGFLFGAGSSNREHRYRFTDRPGMAGTYLYRLRQEDADGLIDYSPVVTVSWRVPEDFSLERPFPNPFNGTTVIRGHIPTPQLVLLRIINMRGEQVTTLIDRQMEAGHFTAHWNGTDRYGIPVASGGYFIQLLAADRVLLRRVLLIR